MTGRLYLIPSLLGESADPGDLPASTFAVLQRLDHLLVETPKQARRFLQRVGIAVSTRRLQVQVLDEHTPESRLPELLAPARAGVDMGLLCDAGCPAVADPGARLVRLAHADGIRVVPLVGPSAVLLALMGSGLGGQRFAFHGYLPIDPARRTEVLRGLEADARRHARTQIFIEAPYRNERLLQAVLAACAPDTALCLATDLTLATESIRTDTIAQWRLATPAIDRRPTVFLLGCESAVFASPQQGRRRPGQRRG
jgi:16S rRNA (cytidine1402-2'-O)-methyltransferase